MKIAKRCLVSGRVQGVYYRASVQQHARQAHLVGHARNLIDGRVEVFVVGDAECVDAIIKWLWVGSPGSHVIAIDVVDVDLQGVEMPMAFTTG